MKKVKSGQFRFDDKCWNSISDKAKDFIKQLLTYDQYARPTAESALQHQWITELSVIEVDESAALGALNNLKGFRAD
jgi:calcium/calmodulin-dependent protein kinase I